MKNDNYNFVVFFDGVCNLCNFFVQTLIAFDKKNKLYFSSLQSNFAQNQLPAEHKQNITPESIVFLHNGKFYAQSDAVLKILNELGGAWKLFLILYAVPRPIRDFFYKTVAKHRYALFGRKAACPMPSPETNYKFFD